MLLRYFQEQPIKPNEFPGLIALCDHYRLNPWEKDPKLSIDPLPVPPIKDAEQRWRMSLAPLGAYSVEADGRYDTLQRIKSTLLDPLIPQMKFWDRWHGGSTP